MRNKSLPRSFYLLGMIGSFLLIACRAPGMKMSPVGSEKVVTVQVNGQQVTLRPLNAQAVAAFRSQAPPIESMEELLSTKPEAYKIGPQDTLVVTVWDHPELTLPLGQFRSDAATGMVVDESGNLYFPYVGKFKVAGLSVTQVREMLTAKLDRVLQKPQVDVKVLFFRSQKAFVGGEVRTPGTYTITDVPFTLAEALNRAGGFLPTADLSRFDLIRGNRKWTLDFLDLMTQGNRIGQILVKDGDTIHVHHREESPVYLLGEVRNPGSVSPINGRLSLAQALAQAGGINNLSADPRSIYVFRRGSSENAVDVFHLDAYNPVGLVLADRFALQPRDVVYVDAGSLVRWNRVVSLIVPTTTLVTSLPGAVNDGKTAFK